MPERKWGSSYRYGFNGKENDNEVKGEGNQQDYGMRIYDTRLGKFLSVDPLTKDYPHYTPYSYAGNKPIKFIDLDGAEEEKHWYDYDINDLMNWFRKPSNPLKTDGFLHKATTSVNRNFNPIYNGTALVIGEEKLGPSSDNVPMSRGDAGFNLVTQWMLWRYAKVAVANASTQMETQMAQNAKAMGKPTQSATQTAAKEATDANVQSATAQPVSKSATRKAYAESVFKSAGKSDNEIGSLMKTIDFNKVVKEVTFKPGDKIFRFERINAASNGEKHFFTDAYGADNGPLSVGFSDASGYKLVTYEVTQQTSAMQSTIRGTKTTQFFSKDLQKNIKKIGEE